MSPHDDPAFQQAMDKLLLQVDTDNVLAVHKAFQEHANALRTELLQVRTNVRVGLCGTDPVSYDAADSFNDKIGRLLKVHWQHVYELEAVANNLQDAARSYGKTEEEIRQSFPDSTPR